MSTTRVVIIEDVALWLNGLIAYLGKQPDVEIAGDATTMAAAKAIVAAQRPDVAVIDMAVDRLSGPVLAQELLRDYPDLGIVMLTACDDEQCIDAMLEIGMRGLVLKRSESHELLIAVRAAARGERYVDPSLRSRAAHGSESRKAAQTLLQTLTGPEQELCRLLAMGHTNAEVSDMMKVSVRTVETYRAQVMAKIAAETRAELVAFALNAGIV